MKGSSSRRTIDCLGMGIIPFDMLFNVAEYPAAGKKVDATGLFMQGGGPVPNVVIGLSRLGFRTALIAAVGDDLFGKILINEIRKDGVNPDFIIVKRKPSALAVGWVDEKSGERTMVLSREVFVSPSNLRLSTYPIPRVLHLDGRDMEATLKLVRWGKRVGALISFDIGSIRNDVSPVFPYVDHLVVAGGYAFPFTKANNAGDAIDELSRLCPGTIVVTEGLEGSTGRQRENGGSASHFQPAFKVPSVDTTGAGDCYHAGYLYGLLKGYDLAERMKLGSASAALKCTKRGARTGMPSLRELNRFLRSDPGTYD